MRSFIVTSKQKKQVIDITDTINQLLEVNGAVSTGICAVFVAHTSAAITVCDLDPGTDLDMLDSFDAMIPQLHFRHPHDPSHVGDHIWSSIIGASTVLLFEKQRLILGTWQRVVLVELNGPRDRTIYINTV